MSDHATFQSTKASYFIKVKPMSLKTVRRLSLIHFLNSFQGPSDHISTYLSLIHSTLESTYLFCVLLLCKTNLLPTLFKKNRDFFQPALFTMVSPGEEAHRINEKYCLSE